MTYNEYQELTKTTDIREQTATVNLRLMCSICGLMEEMEELNTSLVMNTSDEDILSECSDVLWYISSIAIETGITLEELQLRKLPINNKYTNPSKILKKTYRDFNGIMPRAYKEQLWDYLAFILQCILPAYVNVEQAMIYNINKLQSRLARGTIQGDGNHR